MEDINQYNKFSSSNNKKQNYNDLLLCPQCKYTPISLSSIIVSETPMITFTCVNCAKGNSFNYSLDKYIKTLKKENSNELIKCNKHKDSEGEFFCIECQNFQCNKCILFHQVAKINHHFTFRKISLIQKCSIHNNCDLNVYCEICKREICELCIKDHKNKENAKCQNIIDIYNDLSDKMVYLNYDEFENDMSRKDHILNETLNMFTKCYNKILMEFDEFIDKIKNVKIHFNYTINENFKKFVKYAYNNFYYCKDIGMYNYSVISTMKEINDVLIKESQNIKNLENSHQVKISQLKQFMDMFNNIFNKGKDKDKENVIIIDKYDFPLEKSNCNKEKEIGVTINNNTLKEYKKLNDVINKPIYNKEDAKSKFTFTSRTLENFCHFSVTSLAILSKTLIAVGQGEWLNEEKKKSLKLKNTNTIESDIDSHQIIICSINDTKPSYKLMGHSKTISSLILLKDGRLASSSFDKTIKIWDLQTQKPIITISNIQSIIRQIIQINNGNLLSLSEDKLINVYNLKYNKCISSIKIEAQSFKIKELYDNKVIIGISNGKTEMISFNDNNIETYVKRENIFKFKPGAYAYSYLALSDNRILLGKINGRVALLNYKENNNKYEKVSHPYLKVKWHNAIISELILFEKFVVSSSYIGDIKIWDIENWNNIGRFTHGNTVISFAKMNNCVFITGSGDKTVKIWEKKILL